MSSGGFLEKHDIATATFQFSARTQDTFLLQSIAIATMTAMSSTSPTGSIVFLAAAPVGAVAGDDTGAEGDAAGAEGLEEELET